MNLMKIYLNLQPIKPGLYDPKIFSNKAFRIHWFLLNLAVFRAKSFNKLIWPVLPNSVCIWDH